MVVVELSLWMRVMGGDWSMVVSAHVLEAHSGLFMLRGYEEKDIPMRSGVLDCWHSECIIIFVRGPLGIVKHGQKGVKLRRTDIANWYWSASTT